MTTHDTRKDAAGGTAAPSGQTSGLECREYSTPRSGVQPLERRVSIARCGTAFLVASVPANVIALSFIAHEQTIVPTLILSPAEAHALGAALCELADDLEQDAQAREWSRAALSDVFARRPDLAELYEQANGAPESYDSLL